MTQNLGSGKSTSGELQKVLTGIRGLDEVTQGGLPRGRATLVCGGAGCGKTLLAAEFIVHGVNQFDEPGVYMSFEETADELVTNVRSLQLDLNSLIEQNKVVVDHVHIDRSEIEETGEYDLGGIFVRLEHAIQSIGAKRVVLDTLEALFSGLSNAGILRSEFNRLFRFLKDKGVTTVITAERGDHGRITRYGLEEYISDCVVLLDHRVKDQVSTRRLRIVKYRGSAHATNEFPFLIGNDGISVIPITSAGLAHPAPSERISSGIAALDEMLAGKGYFRGTSVLISGTSGSGKTTFASHFADAACARGEQCLYCSFEESPQQLVRNMRSVGLDLSKWMTRNLLSINSARPMRHGLETHLAIIQKTILDQQPRVVIVDPISSFLAAGTTIDVEIMLVRLIDFLKSQQITGLFTSLQQNDSLESTELGISSIIDTWLLLREQECGNERCGSLYILKSRGMPHSKRIRGFRLSDTGIALGEDASA